MKNLMIVTRSMRAGGAERVIAQLVKYLDQMKIQCFIVTVDDAEVFYDLPPGIKIYPIGKKSPKLYKDKILKYKAVRRLALCLRPDLVLALPEDIGVYVIPALLFTRIPVVVSERNNPWMMPWKKETRFLRRLFYPLGAGFIFQTERAAGFFPVRIRKKGIVLPNPLDLERIPPPWADQRLKEIVSSGRLEEQKNFPLIIRAFAKFYPQHPDYVLKIYGEGNLREELKILAVSCLPQGAYSFPGSTRELLEKIRGAAMFVLSSDYEGMPNVLIEAMSMGMPVIATDCPSGGPASLIDNGQNGLLVPVNDEEALVEAMLRLAESKELAAMLGTNALLIKKRLDAVVVVEQWRKYLDGVIG